MFLRSTKIISLIGMVILPILANADIHSFGMNFKNEIQEKEYLGSLCQTNVNSTDPIKNYTKQVCADPFFDVLNWNLLDKTVFGYVNPSTSELSGYNNLINPLEIPELENYKVIVVINKDENQNWGPGQRTLVFAREGALPNLTSNNTQDGLLYYWKTSTGKLHYETPVGLYNIQGFSPNHESSKYKNAFMYWSLFFNGGIAIHSFNEFEMPRAAANLGRKASHGCVRLESHRAQRLYHLVGQVGTSRVPQFDNGRFAGHFGKEYSTLIIVADKNFDIYKAVRHISN